MTRPLLVLVSLLFLLPAPPARAYQRSTTEGWGLGVCLWWGQRQIPFWVNEAGSRSPGDGSELQAILDSATTWTEVPCSDLVFAYQGLTGRTEVGYDRTDGQNLIVWREADCDLVVPHDDRCWDCADTGDDCCSTAYGCWGESGNVIAVTTSTFNSRTGQVLDADIEFNGADRVFTTVDAPVCPGDGSIRWCATDAGCDAGQICLRNGCYQVDCVNMDVANTATHELGHVLGLEHPVREDSPQGRAAWGDTTMYPTAPLGEISKRTLEADDVQGLCDIYPVGGTTLTCLDGDYAWVPQDGTDEVRACGGCGNLGDAGPVALLLVALALTARRRHLGSGPVN